MKFQDDQNPYAPPVMSSDGDMRGPNSDELFPAGRGARWLARFIDSLISLVAIVPVSILLFSQNVMTMRDLQSGGAIVGLAFWGAALPINGYQWYKISQTGQSIGKKAMRIRIVKTDGSQVNFVSGVLVREWVTTLIGLIPIAGPIINLVGTLMIFSESRRCLHDLLAGTRVVSVPITID